MAEAAPEARRKSVGVDVGGVMVGGGTPIVVQSMTNTDTADVDGTVRQIAALNRAGPELVRTTVDRDEAAASVPKIKERLVRLGVHVPIIGHFVRQVLEGRFWNGTRQPFLERRRSGRIFAPCSTVNKSSKCRRRVGFRRCR